MFDFSPGYISTLYVLQYDFARPVFQTKLRFARIWFPSFPAPIPWLQNGSFLCPLHTVGREAGCFLHKDIVHHAFQFSWAVSLISKLFISRHDSGFLKMWIPLILPYPLTLLVEGLLWLLLPTVAVEVALDVSSLFNYIQPPESLIFFMLSIKLQ